MFSADVPLFILRVILIKLLLLGCCFPKCHEMVVFAVFPYFKNESVQLLSHPANRPILLWHVGALVKVVGGCSKISCASSKPIPRLGFALKRLLFCASKSKRILV